MPSPPFLAVRNRNGSNAQVGRLVGGTTFNQVGNNLTSSMETPPNYYQFPHNNAVQFGDSLYAIHRNVVYKLSSPWTTWSTVHTISTMSSWNGYCQHSGIHVVDNGGVPTMLILYVYPSPSYALGAVYSANGSSWTDSGSLGGTQISQYPLGRTIAYRNSVFWLTGYPGSGLVLQYDISTGAKTEYSTLGGSSSPRPYHGAFCVFGNELYLLAYDGNSSNSSQPTLFKLTGGAWAKVQNVGVTGGHTIRLGNAANSYCGFALFESGGKLYAFVIGYYNTSVGRVGTSVYELTPNGATFTESEITSAVVPASLRTTDVGGTISNTIGEPFRWTPGVDNDTDPTNPAVYLWFLNDDNGGNWSYYEWNGPSTQLGSGSGAGSVGLAMPYFMDGGGARWWTSGELHIEITGTSAVLGGEQVSFKAYGDPGNADKTVKFYFNADEEAPDSQATLRGTVTGGSATRNGNQIENVDADGSTTYTCIRDVSADGLGLGSVETLMPTIEV